MQRRLILQWFGSVTSDIRLIFSVHVLNEGINVLQCDSVFMNPSSSVYCNDQRALRSMRVYGDKTAAVIMWSAMEHTTGILDLTANARTLCAVTPVIGNTVFVNEQQTVLRVQAQIDKDIDFDNVKSVLWTYEDRIQCYNHTMARDGKLQTGTSIHTWLETQRNVHRKGKLSMERQKMCEDSGIVLEKQFRDALSMDEKVRVTVYAMKNEISLRNDSTMQYHGISTPIGKIVQTVRVAHNSQKLTNEQVDTLKDAKFDFSPLESTWIKFYAAWRVAKQCGKVVKGQICKDTGLKLGHWQGKQRKLYKKGKLPKSRCARMAEVDPKWYIARMSE
jgi:hypothetical protein